VARRQPTDGHMASAGGSPAQSRAAAVISKAAPSCICQGRDAGHAAGSTDDGATLTSKRGCRLTGLPGSKAGMAMTRRSWRQ
jgi:hypothetical protein